MIDEVGRAVAMLGVRRIGITGTRAIMSSRFYGSVATATVLPPDGPRCRARCVRRDRVGAEP